MKRYINASFENMIHINIFVSIDQLSSDLIVASTYKDINVPDGPVISGVRGSEYTTEEIERFHEFMDSVKELIEGFYHMEIYYKHESNYLSNYFGMLAKDKDGLIVIDFDFTLRIATHLARRTDQSKKEKKKQENQLKDRIGGEKTKPMRDFIEVNGEKYPSYIKAFAAIDEIIADANETMLKNEKYRKKIQ